MLKQNEQLVTFSQKILDFLVIMFCWWGAWFIRFRLMIGHETHQAFDLLFKMGPLISLIGVYYLNRNGGYHSLRFRSKIHEISIILKSLTLTFIFTILSLYFLESIRLSRLMLLLFYGMSICSLTLVRISVRNFLRLIRAKGHNLREVILIGSGKQLVEYIETIRRYKDSGIRIRGWFHSRNACHEFGIPDLGEDIRLMDQLNYDFLVIGESNENHHRVNEYLKKFYDHLIPIQIIPDLTFSLVGKQVEFFGSVPLISFNRPNIEFIDSLLKRIFDIIFSALALIFLSPLLLIISLAVKLSSKGPIFFGQTRITFKGSTFTMWKFRTMKVADTTTEDTEWSNKDNPRKTMIGEFLRKTSLDELPQFFNVLIGNMTVVGPRPERPYFVDKFKKEIPGYMLRHTVKSGITGYAQINGLRGDTSISKRIEFDIFYINNWSLWLDFKIVLLTVFKGFLNKNAY